jgi:hypothetical protein
MQQQLALFHVYHNFVLPHASLRQPLPVPQPTNCGDSVKRWQPWTPAMAAGLTDHVWTLQEVLLFRVPPWPQPLSRTDDRLMRTIQTAWERGRNITRTLQGRDPAQRTLTIPGERATIGCASRCFSTEGACRWRASR